MREFSIETTFKRILKKLHKRDRTTYNQIINKFDEILSSDDVESYKNLRKPLQRFKWVHIGPFVLTFKCLKKQDTIVFFNFDHHDNIYKS